MTLGSSCEPPKDSRERDMALSRNHHPADAASTTLTTVNQHKSRLLPTLCAMTPDLRLLVAKGSDPSSTAEHGGLGPGRATRAPRRPQRGARSRAAQPLSRRNHLPGVCHLPPSSMLKTPVIQTGRTPKTAMNCRRRTRLGPYRHLPLLLQGNTSSCHQQPRSPQVLESPYFLSTGLCCLELLPISPC